MTYEVHLKQKEIVDTITDTELPPYYLLGSAVAISLTQNYLLSIFEACFNPSINLLLSKHLFIENA